MSLFGDDDILVEDTSAQNAASAMPKIHAPNDPKSSPFCLGHDHAEKLFIDLYKKNNLPHAMIFSGLEGIGKTTMAFRLTRFLLKHGKGGGAAAAGLFGEDLPQEITSMDVDADDPVFRRIVSGGHADLLHIHRLHDPKKDKQDANLKVETLRRIEPFLRKTSSEGGWRVVVVEDADTMNRNAQNAILKILEEPPANVLIILITHRPGMLIPTIHSRARMVPFLPLNVDIMDDLLHKQGYSVSTEDMETLCALSEGSVGAALKYLENDGLDMLKDIMAHIAFAASAQPHKIHAFAATLSAPSQDKQYRMFCDIIQRVLRTLVFIKARGQSAIPAHLDTEIIRNMMDDYSLERLLGTSDALKTHFQRVEFSNLDRRDAVRSAFLMISQ